MVVPWDGRAVALAAWKGEQCLPSRGVGGEEEGEVGQAEEQVLKAQE